MSTLQRESPIALPPLVDGERLDRATFHERYEAMPAGTRAELIGGVVYMAALGKRHGTFDNPASFWVAYYSSFTPGVQGINNASVLLGEYGEHQPDVVLIIEPGRGGRTRDEGKYYAGGPELVVETSDSSLARDLGPKLADYDRAGVLEYVVLALDPYRIIWHARRDGRLVEIAPSEDGLHRSAVFPGLWLDPAALLSRDNRSIREVVDLGLATQDHADFVARLAAAGGAGEG